MDGAKADAAGNAAPSSSPNAAGNGHAATADASQTPVNAPDNSLLGVTSLSDGEALTTNTGTFTGKIGFNVVGAASLNTTTASVTFDAQQNAAQAEVLECFAEQNCIRLS